MKKETPVGRPTVITPKVVSQLVTWLSIGLTVREACLEAGISHEAYYSRVRSDEQFADKMAKAQNTVTTTAKKVVATRVLDGDTKTAMWWLDRLEKRELATLQAVADGSQTIDPVTVPEADPEVKPPSTQDLIEYYENIERLIGHKYKQELLGEVYQLPEAERYEAHQKLNALTNREVYELAVAKYGHSTSHREK
jgi:hypothetical protein